MVFGIPLPACLKSEGEPWLWAVVCNFCQAACFHEARQTSSKAGDNGRVSPVLLALHIEASAHGMSVLPRRAGRCQHDYATSIAATSTHASPAVSQMALSAPWCGDFPRSLSGRKALPVHALRSHVCPATGQEIHDKQKNWASRCTAKHTFITSPQCCQDASP